MRFACPNKYKGNLKLILANWPHKNSLTFVTQIASNSNNKLLKIQTWHTQFIYKRPHANMVELTWQFNLIVES